MVVPPNLEPLVWATAGIIGYELILNWGQLMDINRQALREFVSSGEEELDKDN